jgi:myo-inositol 2-dehydrogenase / D-chiro-inositol 1-dehydrogenase
VNGGMPSRRAWLHAASLVPLSAVRGTAANSAVSIGIIGCGGRGTYLGQLLTEHTQARLAALCDLYPESIARARKEIGRSNVEVFQDYGKLLASTVDAVIIATPVFLHPEHFEAAVQAGKHVYQEKPAAPDVEGCRRMERAAASVSNRELCFGFQRRYGVVYTAAYEFFKAGNIGEIRMASARFIKSGGPGRLNLPQPRTMDEKVKQWFYWRTLSGDLIVENNVHLIDVLNWFLGGRPESASGEGGRTMLRAGDIRDHGNITYVYSGGVKATLCGMVLAPQFHRDVREEFFGTKGYLETSENGWRHRTSRAEPVFEKPPRNIAIDSVKQFVQRIETSQPENSIARGVESTLTAILGRLAMDLRRPVGWDEMISLNGWPA